MAFIESMIEIPRLSKPGRPALAGKLCLVTFTCPDCLGSGKRRADGSPAPRDAETDCLPCAPCGGRDDVLPVPGRGTRTVRAFSRVLRGSVHVWRDACKGGAFGWHVQVLNRLEGLDALGRAHKTDPVEVVLVYDEDLAAGEGEAGAPLYWLTFAEFRAACSPLVETRFGAQYMTPRDVWRRGRERVREPRLFASEGLETIHFHRGAPLESVPPPPPEPPRPEPRVEPTDAGDPYELDGYRLEGSEGAGWRIVRGAEVVQEFPPGPKLTRAGFARAVALVRLGTGAAS